MSETAAIRFTTTESDALGQMADSYAWRTLMAKSIIPRVRQITEMLDRPHVDQQGRGDFLRGEKRAWLSLINLIYQTGGRRNPLEEHALALEKYLFIQANEDENGKSTEPIIEPTMSGRPGHDQGFPV